MFLCGCPSMEFKYLNIITGWLVFFVSLVIELQSFRYISDFIIASLMCRKVIKILSMSKFRIYSDAYNAVANISVFEKFTILKRWKYVTFVCVNNIIFEISSDFSAFLANITEEEGIIENRILFCINITVSHRNFAMEKFSYLKKSRRKWSWE